MKTQITALIQTESQQEHICKYFQNLTVKIFQVTLSTENLLQSFAVDENGTLSGEVDTVKATTLMARLYLTDIDKRQKDILIAESGPHCPNNDLVFIRFTYDPAKFSKPLYTTVKTAVAAQLGKINLQNITDIQRQQLQCIACVGERTLARLISANKLYGDLKTNLLSCGQRMEAALKLRGADPAYLKNALSNMQLLSNELVIESIIFALIQNNNNPQLQQVLTLSASQLQAKLTLAVTDNIIAAVSNLQKIVDGLLALRNCLVFNSDYDPYFYDAKLIHLSTMDLYSKNILLDKSIEAGSLVGYLSEQDNLTSTAD